MESTLSLKKTDYESKVAKIAGWGRPTDELGDEAWRDEPRKVEIVKDCVESGLRNFYHCGYAWSFLKPFASLGLVSGERTVKLPDDFGGLEGKINVSDGSNSFSAIRLVNPGRIEECYAESSESTGSPQMAALRAKKGTDAHKGQPQELYVFPEADDDYTLKVQYYLLPNYLDGSSPYAYGGAEHVETVLESCLAVLEERWNNIMSGPHAMKFQQQLERSMRMDARKKPQHVGENRDRSDERDVCWADDFPTITINGVEAGP